MVNINLDQISINQGIYIKGKKVLYESYSGYSVNDAGDFNGDGYNDIIIGAPGQCGISSQGQCYVIYGGQNLQNIDMQYIGKNQGFSILGENIHDCICKSVSGGGDINKDGYDDLIIGAPYATVNGISSSGKVYVVFGTKSSNDIIISNFNYSYGFTISGEGKNHYFGSALNFVGDINKDGFDDIVIGAPGANSQAGVTYVVFGKKFFSNVNVSNISSTDGFKILGANTGDQSGYSVNKLKDYNGDGINDVIIGAPYAYPGGRINAGISYIIFGGNYSYDIQLSIINESQGKIIVGCTAEDRLGMSVSGGDINGDNYIDIVIGSPGAYQFAGATYIILGNKLTSLSTNICELLYDPSKMLIFVGESKDDDFGYSVDSFHDVNKDGYQDILIGAWGSDISYTEAGTSYLIYGKKSFINYVLYIADSFTENDGFAILGPTKDGYSGFSVSTVLDINNDSYSDMIIGTYGANNFAGTTYIIFGASSGFITPSPTIAPTSISQVSDQTSIIENSWFQVISSVATFVLSTVAGWLLREKIIFYILSNWGYHYKLLYNRDDFLQAGEIGFTLVYDKQKKTDRVICKHGDNKIKVEINNGINHGLPEGIYNLIVQELKEPSKSFKFLQSEKNKILDFLLSRPGLVDFSDLGYIRGNIYKHLLSSNYKQKYEDKYKFNIRNNDELERFSYISDGNSVAVDNPLVEDIQTQDIEAKLKIVIDELVTSEKKEDDYIEKLTQTKSDEDSKTCDDAALEISQKSNNFADYSFQSNKKSCVVMSIDAMIDPEHIRLQNEEFVRLSNQLMNFVYKEFSNDINWLLLSKSDSETLLLENAPKGPQAIVLYELPPLKDNFQFASSNNLMLSLISVKQILHNLPLLHYLAQNIINYLGYNATLPDPLDNKELLISADLVLGNLAAQYLPEQKSIMNGMFVSTASTVGYATRLIVADYLKNQEPSGDPIEFSMQCVSMIAAYSLPGVVNYALTKAILPDVKMSISMLDILGSSSFGVVQCYNNYKVVYGAENKATVTDVVVPYIADAITLWSLRDYLNFDVSNTANLMMNIKNTMSVAATTYATHCFGNMFVDLLPQDVKEEYISLPFGYVNEVVTDLYSLSSNSYEQMKVLIMDCL